MCETNFSQPIVEAIVKFLEENDITYSLDRKTGEINYVYTLIGKIKKVHYRIEVHNSNYVVYAYLGVGVDFGDKDIMAAMAEFICRVNFNIQPGNFDLDMDAGVIRYKYYMSCNAIVPSPEAIEKSVMYLAVIIDSFSSGIFNVLFGNATPEEAAESCSNNFINRAKKEIAGLSEEP